MTERRDLTAATRDLWAAFHRMASISQDPVEIAKALRDTAPTPELLAFRRLVGKIDDTDLRADVKYALALIAGRLRSVNIARRQQSVVRFPLKRGRYAVFEQEIGIVLVLSILHSVT